MIESIFIFIASLRVSGQTAADDSKQLTILSLSLQKESETRADGIIPVTWGTLTEGISHCYETFMLSFITTSSVHFTQF